MTLAPAGGRCVAKRLYLFLMILERDGRVFRMPDEAGLFLVLEALLVVFVRPVL